MRSCGPLSPSLARPGGALVREGSGLSRPGQVWSLQASPCSSVCTYLPACRAPSAATLRAPALSAKFFRKRGGLSEGRELSPKHISAFALGKKKKAKIEERKPSARVASRRSRKAPDSGRNPFAWEFWALSVLSVSLSLSLSPHFGLLFSPSLSFPASPFFHLRREVSHRLAVARVHHNETQHDK